MLARVGEFLTKHAVQVQSPKPKPVARTDNAIGGGEWVPRQVEGGIRVQYSVATQE